MGTRPAATPKTKTQTGILRASFETGRVGTVLGSMAFELTCCVVGCGHSQNRHGVLCRASNGPYQAPYMECISHEEEGQEKHERKKDRKKTTGSKGSKQSSRAEPDLKVCKIMADCAVL